MQHLVKEHSYQRASRVWNLPISTRALHPWRLLRLNPLITRRFNDIHKRNLQAPVHCSLYREISEDPVWQKKNISPGVGNTSAPSTSRVTCGSKQQPREIDHGDGPPPCLPGFRPRAGLPVPDDGRIGEGAGQAYRRGRYSPVLPLPPRVLPAPDGGSPARRRRYSLMASPAAACGGRSPP